MSVFEENEIRHFPTAETAIRVPLTGFGPLWAVSDDFDFDAVILGMSGGGLVFEGRTGSKRIRNSDKRIRNVE